MPSERLQDHETPQLPHRMVGNPWTLIFFWDLAIQNATVDEMRCVCVDEIHSDGLTSGLTSDLQESLDHLLYHPNIFLAQYDHAKNKGFRCCGFCSPILLFLPLLKQFNTPHMARLKHILFHVSYSPSV